MKTYKGLIGFLEPNQILVFGSNPEGRHGAGVAKLALDKFGAKWGIGRGLYGQSYGLITKNLKPFFYEKETGIEYEKAGFRSVSTKQIVENIKELYEFAVTNPELEFHVAYTDSGKNLNGYTAKEMASMFATYKIPDNMVFHEGFGKLIEDENDEVGQFLMSDKFKEGFAKTIEEDTWGQGLPKIYMNNDGDIVEHWKDGTINIIKRKE